MNPLRRFFIPVFLPAVLFASGEGALVPVLHARATELGASVALAGLIAGMLMIGQVLGDLPSGAVIARFGEQQGMIIAAGVGVIGTFIAMWSSTLPLLVVGVLLIGVASAMFSLGRHALLTEWVPVNFRARAMSMLGGTTRAGMFIGPLAAAPVIAIWGAQAAFWVCVATCVIVGVFLLLTPDPDVLFAGAFERRSTASRLHESSPTSSTENGDAPASAASQTLWQTLRSSFSLLIRLGVAVGIVQLLRATRQVILPLWGVHIGLDLTVISLIMGIAGGVDLALFYTSGQIMDRFGRAWVAIPTLIGLALAHAALFFVGNEATFLGAAIFMSVANGLGSGIVMTLGADLAPLDAPASFLGGWRLFADAGSAAGPLLLSAVAATAGLPWAAFALGGVGVGGAWMMWRFLPQFLPSGLSGLRERTAHD